MLWMKVIMLIFIALASTSNVREKVKLILNELENTSRLNVPDPYYGGDNGFKNVYEMLNEACSVIASKLPK